jgi:hypothetical protein
MRDEARWKWPEDREQLVQNYLLRLGPFFLELLEVWVQRLHARDCVETLEALLSTGLLARTKLTHHKCKRKYLGGFTDSLSYLSFGAAPHDISYSVIEELFAF